MGLTDDSGGGVLHVMASAWSEWRAPGAGRWEAVFAGEGLMGFASWSSLNAGLHAPVDRPGGDRLGCYVKGRGNHRWTQMNTDDPKALNVSCPGSSGHDSLSKVLSVFICVHLWFQPP